MLPEVLQKGLSKEQRGAGLYLVEDADHTLTLMQRQPKDETRRRPLPITRATFPQSISIKAIQDEAQKWVRGKTAPEPGWFAGCEKPLHDNPDDSN